MLARPRVSVPGVAPAASGALVSAFAERGITFTPNRRVRALDPAQRVAILDDASEMPFDLFLGIPTHRVPPWWRRAV
jgi:sulfide:quinone oxidoreductase